LYKNPHFLHQIDPGGGKRGLSEPDTSPDPTLGDTLAGGREKTRGYPRTMGTPPTRVRYLSRGLPSDGETLGGSGPKNSAQEMMSTPLENSPENAI